MSAIDWKMAENKLERMLAATSELDIYLILNVVAPLNHRYHNNHERSVKLYNAIMGIPLRALAKKDFVAKEKVQT